MSAGERHAYHLPTPCGGITVRDDRNNLVPFALRESTFAAAFEAGSGAVYNTPHKYIIALSASMLEKGRVYRIALEGIGLCIGSSDECCECVCGSGNGFSIAIGASDPNEPEKHSQMTRSLTLEGLVYTITAAYDFDRSSFTRYDLQMLPDFSGFRFERLDDLCDEIVFPVAWLETSDDTQFETEDAVEFWVL